MKGIARTSDERHEHADRQSADARDPEPPTYEHDLDAIAVQRRMPGVVTVVGPDEARAAVADWALAGAARYR